MSENRVFEGVSAISKDQYQWRPQPTLLGSNAHLRPDWLDAGIMAAAITNIIKIGGPISILLGALLLGGYLRNEGAPLPATDASIGVLASLVCVVFLFLAWVLASILFLPTIVPRKVDPRARVWAGVEKYLLLFSPYLAFMLFFLVRYSAFEWKWNMQCAVAAAALVLFAWGWRWKYSKAEASKPSLKEALVGSASSFISSTGIITILLGVVVQFENMPVWGGMLICIGIPVCIHFLTVSVLRDWKARGAAFVTLLLWMMLWPGLAYLGGASLQYIGVGGGMPVSIRVRSTAISDTVPSATNVSTATDMTGCLVLMTNSDVLFRRTERAIDCKLHPVVMGGETLTPVQTYSRVVRLQRADALRVSKFPDSCSTVDGIPTC